MTSQLPRRCTCSSQFRALSPVIGGTMGAPSLQGGVRARIPLAMLAALFVSSCVTTDASLPPADDPFPANYRALIAAHIDDIFKDPDSVRDASISAPKRGSGPYLSPQGFITPWIVCVRANAKNSFGGYTGKKLTAVIISRNAFVEAKGGPSEYGDLGSMWCADHQTYEPFPELTTKRSAPSDTPRQPDKKP